MTWERHEGSETSTRGSDGGQSETWSQGGESSEKPCLSAVFLVLLKKFCRNSPSLSDPRLGNGYARAKLG